MSRALQSTLEILSNAAREHDAVAVGYSGGKDSLCVMDLAMRSFKRVEPWFMYLVPGLECVETELAKAEVRWGRKVHQVPHWLITKLLKGGVHCNPANRHDGLPDWKLRDVFDAVKAATSCDLVMTGAKKSDSIWRKRNLATTKGWTDVCYPLLEWMKGDVLAYLAARGLPVPESSGKNATGVDLSTPSLLWLHDAHPADFKRLEETFPFIGAVVARRSFYG